MRSGLLVLVVVLMGCGLSKAPTPNAKLAQVQDENMGSAGVGAELLPYEESDAGMGVTPIEADAAAQPEQDAGELQADAAVDAAQPVDPACAPPAPQPLPVDCALGFVCMGAVQGFCVAQVPGKEGPGCTRDADCTQGDALTCSNGYCHAACVQPQCVVGDADRTCCDPVQMPGLHAGGTFTQRCIEGVWSQCKASMYTAAP